MTIQIVETGDNIEIEDSEFKLETVEIVQIGDTVQSNGRMLFKLANEDSRFKLTTVQIVEIIDSC